MSRKNNFTTGRVYEEVLKLKDAVTTLVQRLNKFLITNEIKQRVIDGANGSDVAIVEVGGTVLISNLNRFLKPFVSSVLKLAENVQCSCT